MFLRGLNQITTLLIINLAFYYAALANINIGVIAGLFTNVVIFNSILFYFVYKEVPSWRKLIGMAIIIAGVLCISWNNGEKS